VTWSSAPVWLSALLDQAMNVPSLRYAYRPSRRAARL